MVAQLLLVYCLGAGHLLVGDQGVGLLLAQLAELWIDQRESLV